MSNQLNLFTLLQLKPVKLTQHVLIYYNLAKFVSLYQHKEVSFKLLISIMDSGSTQLVLVTLTQYFLFKVTPFNKAFLIYLSCNESKDKMSQMIKVYKAINNYTQLNTVETTLQNYTK